MAVDGAAEAELARQPVVAREADDAHQGGLRRARKGPADLAWWSEMSTGEVDLVLKDPTELAQGPPRTRRV